MIDSSEINAELVYRGSAVAPNGRITLLVSAKDTTTFGAVEAHIESIRRCHDHSAIKQARTLWAGMLEAKTYPPDDQVIALIANSSSQPSATS